MTSQQIKNKILNYEITEEILEECLEEDFRKTIIGILNALYILLGNYKKNQTLALELLFTLESLADAEQDIKKLKIFHGEIKTLIGTIYKQLNPNINYQLVPAIKQLQKINKRINQTIAEQEASEQIATMEVLIYEQKNLKIISGLIRENKNLLKIIDAKGENVLYKLLKRYNSLEDEKDKINYLYQVISLFINSEDLNIEIIRNVDNYLSALTKLSAKHVIQVRNQLQAKKKAISLSDLEKKYQVYIEYPSEIEQELNQFKISPNKFLDFRKQPCFTIDDDSARCLDDAIYFRKNKDGSYTLYVHITYIPALIPYDSKMNQESIRRVESYYLIDGTYCLYPDYISNYLASLLPNSIRYAQTGIWQVEPNMTLIEDSFQLAKTIINSHHRLSYEGADEIIGSKSDYHLSKTLTALGNFALKQRKRNNTKESYREKENSHSNQPNHESRFVDKYVAANIVQECALLFGRSKAELYKNKNYPYIFRACGEQQTLNLNSEHLKHLTKQKQEQISEMVAYYTSTPQKHHGLGYDAYCHGGSPARRSPDGQNQYIDDALIFTPNPTDKTIQLWEERTEQLARYYNEASQRIDAFSSQYNYLTNKGLIKRPNQKNYRTPNK